MFWDKLTWPTQLKELIQSYIHHMSINNNFMKFSHWKGLYYCLFTGLDIIMCVIHDMQNIPLENRLKVS